MNLKKKLIKEYGSFFHKIDLGKLEHKTHFSPVEKKLFYNGRQAIKFLLDSINENNIKINNIWIPEYYCQHVSSWLKTCYSNIKTYKVDPGDENFFIEASEFIENNDVLIVNNFWGISKYKINTTANNFILIEDHSHGWLTDACVNSNADYCFASLRKSLPIPLGGILWSPKKHSLKTVKFESEGSFQHLWHKIDSAMSKKSQYLNQNNESSEVKQEFLNLVSAAEMDMHTNYSVEFLTPDCEKVIENFLNVDYKLYKSNNLKTLIDTLENNPKLNPIYNYESFGLIYYFRVESDLTRFKNYLIKKNVYPSNLWPENKTGYGSYLNLHVDFRYTKDDIQNLAKIINLYK